jgi:TRAP-type C4-dicarboxylate transport system permease small subunit
VGRIETALVRVNAFVVGLMMIVMFVLVFTNVVTRYCFGFSIATAEEISTFLMIWVTYLGAGLALREGRHACIDILQDRLGEGARRALRILLGIVLIVFFGLLAWYGARFAHFGWGHETIATQIPKGIPYLCIPIGAALFIVHLLFVFRRWLDRTWEGGGAPADDLPTEGDR